MKLIIHRGTHEIGGTCIRIATDRTSVLFDAGLPLSPDSEKLSPQALEADAVVISHPHQDHCGLLDVLPDSMPVHIGQVGKRLLDATRLFLRRQPLRNTFSYFQAWQPFMVGDIKITPYLVDHSAADAYAFLIESDNRRVIYSGDFRAHGRKSVLFDSMIDNPMRDIDVLLMEGTMMQRDNADFPTEQSVENAIADILSSQRNISFLISSSQNIDRIVSAYRACLRTGKTLVIDIYSAWVLEQLLLVTSGVPTIDWKSIKVAFDKPKADVLMDQVNRGLFGSFIDRAIRNRIKVTELTSNPERYLMLSKISGGRFISRFVRDNQPVNVIYSQWQGYLNGEEGESRHIPLIRAMRAGNSPGVVFTYAHTSGHATITDLQRFAGAVSAKKLIPVHTEHGHLYSTYFKNVVPLNDGEHIEL
ncbi:MBL fold metallo-hydrolase [Trichlorobacter lovleyi]|uniref:MBL fold metallo-hydrolase n=1 Tax=Trichlorobacter lovleyi TaxID=313985 RepID=UPI0023F2A055|nr:MBL fold metallo-hydrolase [Trichlorobacter lovleyi]